MRSMTGFGRGTAEQAGARATVDIRAVNHRFLDLKLRGGPLAPAVEEQLASRVRGALERGSVTVTVHVQRAGGAMHIDAAAARAAYDTLAELARNLGTPPPELALVLQQPGVVVQGDEETEDSPALVAALDAALAQLAVMREAEGGALARELTRRVDELARIHARVSELAKGLPEQLHKRLSDRLRKLVRDEASDKANDAAGWLDPNRLAQEVALLADRADVTEELVRLASHLEQARALIAGSAPAGRRLDFLVQELGREINTIGSKSAAAEISALVVEAKAVLEKVREQVQNVE